MNCKNARRMIAASFLAVSCTVVSFSVQAFDFSPVSTKMNAPELNKESDKSFEVDNVSTTMEAPALHKAWDGMLDLAPVSTDYEMPDLISMTEYHLNGPVSTQFSLDLQEAFKGIHLDPVHTTLNLDLGEIGIAADTLFDYDKSELRPEGKEVLSAFFGDFVKTLVEEDRIDKLAYIDFAGHTDSDGSFQYNLQLSLDRGYSVYDYCLSNCMGELSEEQIAKIVEVSHVNGYAYNQPVLDADGNEDKAASRRVTIRYYYSANKIDE